RGPLATRSGTLGPVVRRAADRGEHAHHREQGEGNGESLMTDAIPLDISLEALEERIRGMTPEQRKALAGNVKPYLAKPWLPQPGPQTEAYYSEADETLYGGAAGGGKTDVIIGLATTAHYRSLIFRSQAKDLDGLWDRLTEVSSDHLVKNDTIKKAMRLKDGRTIEGGHLEKPGS